MQKTCLSIIQPSWPVRLKGLSLTILTSSSTPLLPLCITPHRLCYDLNYGAKAKDFLEKAKNAGAAMAIDGLGMLIEQAAESFFTWHKVMPNTELVFGRIKENNGKHT